MGSNLSSTLGLGFVNGKRGIFYSSTDVLKCLGIVFCLSHTVDIQHVNKRDANLGIGVNEGHFTLIKCEHHLITITMYKSTRDYGRLSLTFYDIFIW